MLHLQTNLCVSLYQVFLVLGGILDAQTGRSVVLTLVGCVL